MKRHPEFVRGAVEASVPAPSEVAPVQEVEEREQEEKKTEENIKQKYEAGKEQGGGGQRAE